MSTRRPSVPLSALALLVVLLAAACGGDDQAATCAAPGGAVPADPNLHCDAPQSIDEAACTPPEPGPGEPDAGPPEEPPPAVAGTEGDDDDCKYYVTWTSTPVCRDQNVTFTLTLMTKADSEPVSGANPSIEAFLDDTHPAPNTNATSRETSDGVYEIGPIQFDEAGQWTVRFHYFETCVEGEESPHSHAAFFVDVP